MNCDCNEFCQLVLVVKLLGILAQLFKNFILVSTVDVYGTICLCIYRNNFLHSSTFPQFADVIQGILTMKSLVLKHSHALTLIS